VVTVSRRKNKTPEQLLKQGLRVVQRQIEALEKLQSTSGLEVKEAQLLVQLVETVRKAVVDQFDPRKLLAKMSEADLEKLARGTEPIPKKT
jgi:uncharacterized membrane protein YccC